MAIVIKVLASGGMIGTTIPPINADFIAKASALIVVESTIKLIAATLFALS